MHILCLISRSSPGAVVLSWWKWILAVVSDSRPHIDRDFINRSDHTNANSNLQITALQSKPRRPSKFLFTCHLDVLHAFIFSTSVMFPILLYFSPCFLLPFSLTPLPIHLSSSSSHHSLSSCLSTLYFLPPCPLGLLIRSSHQSPPFPALRSVVHCTHPDVKSLHRWFVLGNSSSFRCTNIVLDHFYLLSV
jgi:hypothetical protein